MKRALVASLLLAGAVGTGVEMRLTAHQRQTLAAERKRLAQLETRVHAARAQRDQTVAARAQSEEKVAALRAAVEAQEARAATLRPWWSRIKQLQQRLDASPEENIPELKLLGMKDWIEAVLYAETATDEQVRKVFAELRTRARTRLASRLAEALKKFCDASGGELPANVLDLLPHLAPPAEAAMLTSYQLARGGKSGALDEVLLSSVHSESNTKLNITLQGYSWTASSENIAEASRTLDAVGGDSLGGSRGLGEQFNVAAFTHSLGELGPAMEAAGHSFGEEFGDLLKKAVKHYASIHGRPPPHMAALGDALPDRTKFVALATRMMAEFHYRLDHEGQAPGDGGSLQPYLENNAGTEHLLQLFKLTLDGDSVTMSFSLGP